MAGRRLDFKKQIYNHNKSGWEHQYHMNNSHSIPTQAQKKYHEYLFKLCSENGLTAIPAERTRSEIASAIHNMQKYLKQAHIPIESPFKYKFDKNGNVVEIATGKIVQRRDGK